ncbi:MAG: leucine--tRNA ligase [Nitrospira sp.]|nr:MAG: leucine--tRNA ligase [Nitrospira sp.]
MPVEPSPNPSVVERSESRTVPCTPSGYPPRLSPNSQHACRGRSLQVVMRSAIQGDISMKINIGDERRRSKGRVLGMAIALGLVSALPAFAETYVAGMVGATLAPDTVRGRVNDPSFVGLPEGTSISNVQLNSSIMYGAKVGHYFNSIPWLGVELEAFVTAPHRPAQRLTLNAPGIGTIQQDEPGATNRIVVVSPLIMVRYQAGAFEPYAGVGPGVFFLHQEQFTASGSPSNYSQSNTGYGLNTQVGLRYRLTGHVSMFGEWHKATLVVDHRRVLGLLGEQGTAVLTLAFEIAPAALGTVLANEEIVDGKSEVGGFDVIRKPMRQWVLKITAYADRLLEDLTLVDWPPSTLEMQKNWIGRSIGAEVDFVLADQNGAIRVFTTRPDTLFGATYMVLAPEHPLVDVITRVEQKEPVAAYRAAAAKKSDLQRQELEKEKTGVFTGGYAINPVNQERLPIWIADYVLMSYGTGAIMAVPAHDVRDWAFAHQYALPIREVISGGNVQEAAFTDTDRGKVVNSSTGDGTFSLNGLTSSEAIPKITDWLAKQGQGTRAVNYKLRDWLFARQRYWGEPFPIVWVDGEARPLPEEQLPLALPESNNFKPSGTGESPLANLDQWLVTTDPTTNKPARRETNTMPQWAGSCWYYLRFIDPKSATQLVDPEKERYWMPVDLYIGGSEHAVLHLLYARFWHKVLFDIGVVSTPEPFRKLVHQGIVLGEDNQKMSKSRGNVVNPDDMIDQFGADAVRLYEMFMGPLEAMKPWSTRGVEGVTRFLERVWRLMVDEQGRLSHAVVSAQPSLDHQRLLHQTIKKVTEDIEALRFNTAISQMMIFTNEMTKAQQRPRSVIEPFVLLLSPFAPHVAEELWDLLGHQPSVSQQPWPIFDPAMTVSERMTIPVQVNGRLRAKIDVPVGTSRDEIERLARAEAAEWIQGKESKKVIYVEKKLLNFVV